MGFAISNLASNNLRMVQENVEYQLSLILNTLQRLSMQSASITEQQSYESQAYLAQFTDEEGYVDQAAIEYVNSEAFNSKYNAQLRKIQAKEKILNGEKLRLETRQRTSSTERESWEKNTTSCIEKTFKYGN